MSQYGPGKDPLMFRLWEGIVYGIMVIVILILAAVDWLVNLLSN